MQLGARARQSWLSLGDGVYVCRQCLFFVCRLTGSVLHFHAIRV